LKIINQKKFIDKERNMKMEQMGNKLVQRLGGFGVSGMSSSFKMLNKGALVDPEKEE
jgi:acetate kinase